MRGSVTWSSLRTVLWASDVPRFTPMSMLWHWSLLKGMTENTLIKLSFARLGGPACECNGNVLALLKHRFDTCSIGSRSMWPWPTLSVRRYAPHNIECVSLTKHVFCTRPYHSDQSDAFRHKTTLSEKYFIYIVI